MEHLKTQSAKNVDTTLFLLTSYNIKKRFKRVRIPFPAPHLRCAIRAPQVFFNIQTCGQTVRFSVTP